MAISRRMLLGAGLVTGSAAAYPAEACSLVASVRPIGFSDAACRRSLRALIALINAAPALSDGEVSERASDLGVSFDSDVTDRILNYPQRSPIEDIELIRGWSASDGKPDRSPLNLREINPLKNARGVALYQFTLRRERYHAGVSEADADSCSGPTDPYFDDEERSYLGLFLNNRLREVSAFDAWLRKM